MFEREGDFDWEDDKSVVSERGEVGFDVRVDAGVGGSVERVWVKNCEWSWVSCGYG